MNKLFGIFLLIVAVFGGLYYFSPGFRAILGKQIDKVSGWNDEARKSDPAGFLDYSMKQLQTNVDKFTAARGELVQKKAKMEEALLGQKEKLSFAEKQLGEFKNAYKSAVEKKAWPVSMAGRSYSETELKSQVAMLLSQKGNYETILKQFEDTVGKLADSERQLIGRLNESKVNIEKLNSQKTLIETAKITADTENMMKQVHEVLIANEAMTQTSAVRTVEELMKDAESKTKAEAAVSDPAVAAFLNG